MGDSPRIPVTPEKRTSTATIAVEVPVWVLRVLDRGGALALVAAVYFIVIGIVDGIPAEWASGAVLAVASTVVGVWAFTKLEDAGCR